MTATTRTALPEKTAALIGAMRRSLQNCSNATSDMQRRSAFRFLTERVLQLQAERDRLAAKLDAGWDHLDTHPDDERETRWIAWLHAYEAVCDALNGANQHAGGAA